MRLFINGFTEPELLSYKLNFNAFKTSLPTASKRKDFFSEDYRKFFQNSFGIG